MAKSHGLSLAGLRQRLEAGEVAAVYLLLGSEQTLRRHALEALARRVCGEDPEPGALVGLDAGEVGLEGVLDEARSLPLFALASRPGAPSRVVLARRFDVLLAGHRRRRGATASEEKGRVGGCDPAPLLAYLREPVSETCLVLEVESLDARTKVAKELLRSATVVNCAPPEREGDVRLWIEATVRRQGHSIEPEAVVWLTEMVGARLTLLERELEKAMLAVGPGGRIDVTTLAGLTGRRREHTVFELTDALVAGDVAGAVTLLNRLIDDGEEPLRLLPMIAWITRQLLIAHDLGAAGVPRRQILSSLAGRWNQRAQILERGCGTDRRRLEAALVACAEADLRVKRLRDARAGADRLRPARGHLEALCRQLATAR